MQGLNVRVLFTYRLLVQAGYLDDDVAADPGAWPPRGARRIAVQEDLCIGCYACRDVCPASAVHIWDGLAHITNPLACGPCAAAPCVPACPTAALEDGRLRAPGLR